jgi:hypothetical protein
VDMHRLLIVDGYDGAARPGRADSTAIRPQGKLLTCFYGGSDSLYGRFVVGSSQGRAGRLPSFLPAGDGVALS